MEIHSTSSSVPSLVQTKYFLLRNGLKESSVDVYLIWIRRFSRWCECRRKSVCDSLTEKEVRKFALHYTKEQGINALEGCRVAHMALRAYLEVISASGFQIIEWKRSVKKASPRSAILRKYLAHRSLSAGSEAWRERVDISHIGCWLSFLKTRHKTYRNATLKDTDAFLVFLRTRYALSTISGMISSLRVFLRFLFIKGYLCSDLSISVQAPHRKPRELPRALPWSSIIKILKSIDRKTLTGKRDYSILLLMALYGLGAAEVINLSLNDLDWVNAAFTVVRPKTAAVIRLPFLPAAQETVANYLSGVRPPNAPCRNVFVRRQLPHHALTSSAIRFMIRKYASKAGLEGIGLGAHVLRHSHATRQIDQHASPYVVSEILGHKDTESTSVYTKVAVERLRGLALPIPK